MVRDSLKFLKVVVTRERSVTRPAVEMFMFAVFRPRGMQRTHNGSRGQEWATSQKAVITTVI